MIKKEYLTVAVAGSGVEGHHLFKNAFREMKMEVRVRSFYSKKELMNHLENTQETVPDVLFLRYDLPDGEDVAYLQRIRADAVFDSMITVVYAPAIPPETEEYLFVCGAHVVMQQPDSYGTMKKVLTEFMGICWQFHTSGLNRNNFIMKV